MSMNREGITKTEKEIKKQLNKAENIVKELEDSEADLSTRNYHNGIEEGLELALAITMKNKYAPELESIKET